MTRNAKQIQRDVFKEEFKKFFRENIRSGLDKIEIYRKWAIAGCSVIGAIIAIIAIIVIYIVFMGETEVESDLFELVGYIIFGLCAAITGIIKLYKTKAKEGILPKLLGYIGNFEINKNTSVIAEDRSYIETLDLFRHFNRYKCDDRFSGIYKGIKVDIAEIDLKKESGSGKRRHVETIFSGVFLKIPSLKKFKGKTIVVSNFQLGIKGEQQVHLEDPEFEKRYNTYGTDQIEARYLITPAFMNRMIELSKKGACKNISLSFEYDSVNIAVSSNKDWFEVPFTKPATEISNYRGIILDLLVIFSIIDSLKLDMNIGM